MRHDRNHIVTLFLYLLSLYFKQEILKRCKASYVITTYLFENHRYLLAGKMVTDTCSLWQGLKYIYIQEQCRRLVEPVILGSRLEEAARH